MLKSNRKSAGKWSDRDDYASAILTALRQEKPQRRVYRAGDLKSSARASVATTTSQRSCCFGAPPASSADDAAEERRSLVGLLDLELKASSSLNDRATTLFALLTATSVALILFATNLWLGDGNGGGTATLVGVELDVAKITLALALVAFMTAAVLGLILIWPNSPWRHAMRALVSLHVVGARPSQHAGVLIDIVDAQRIRNEGKALLGRWQLGLAASGVAVAVVHVLFVLFWIE